MRLHINIDDVYVYTASLPSPVNGVTVIKNGDYLVFINEEKCPEKQYEALEHELRHIKKGHLYSEIKFIVDCEREACT